MACLRTGVVTGWLYARDMEAIATYGPMPPGKRESGAPRGLGNDSATRTPGES